MITTKQFIGAAFIGLITLSSATIAQTVVESESHSSGLIGKRYVGADFLMQDHRDIPDNGYGGALLINQPVSDVVDLRGTFAFTQANGDLTDVTKNAVDVEAIYYAEQDGYKPFMSASLGYAWDKFKYPAPRRGDNDEGAFYSVGLGVEVPLSAKTAGIGEVSFSDGLNSGDEDSWGLELGLNHWLTDKLALKGSAYIVEDDSVTFRIGVRLGF